MTEYHDRQTMELLRERLAHADSELEAAQHFLAPRSAEEAEMDIVRRNIVQPRWPDGRRGCAYLPPTTR